MQRTLIKPLTSLRFIFAFMVFLSHCHFLNNSDFQSMRWMFNAVFFEGYIGVTFFFILSGFILTYTYYQRLNDRVEIKQYFIARLTKIYPTHILLFITMAIYIIYKSGVTSEILIKAIINLSLLQSFVPNKDVYFSFNMPSWSLSCEIFFYLTLPFLITFIKKHNVKTLVAIWLLTTITLIILMFSIPTEYQHYTFYINPIVRFTDFSLGIILFFLWKIIKDQQVKINYSILEVLSLIIFVIFFYAHSKIPIVFRFSIYYWIPISLIIIVFAIAKGRISSLLSSSLLFLLGKISFAFYMVHQPIINFINKFYFFSAESTFLFSLLLSTIVSYLLYKYFEKPLSVKYTISTKPRQLIK